jgi:hypothetical protein
MHPFLRQPPPFAIAIINAFVGLLGPACIVIFHVLFVELSERSELGESSKLLFYGTIMGAAGAMVGLLACGGLAWGTPGGKRHIGFSYLLVAATFATATAVVFSQPGGLRADPGSTWIMFAFMVACGGLMAWAMARAARNFGASAFVQPRWIAAIGAAIAAIWLGLSLGFADFSLLMFLPMLWLGAVTYVCLRP